MKQFVFVLGAGASVDLKLPMGAELTGHIKDALNYDSDGFNVTGGDLILRRALVSSEQAHPDWYSASRLISSAMPLAPSIDNFVDVHKDDKDVAFCAKAAITRCILKAERNSTIYVDNRNTYNTVDFQKNIGAWHTLFFRILTTNCTLHDLAGRLKNIGIISFNYDRCFEHFLFHAIKTYYRITNGQAAEILDSLDIYHPYGQVGDLTHLSATQTVDFGEELDPSRIVKVSQQIRTFTETVDDDSETIKQIRDLASQCRNLVFLGFAFHPLNVKLLFPTVPSGYPAYDRRIIATAFGSSDSDLNIIKNDLRARYSCPVENADFRSNLKCDKLFMEYSRTLAM